VWPALQDGVAIQDVRRFGSGAMTVTSCPSFLHARTSPAGKPAEMKAMRTDR
jgi:hypothetical protein